MPAVRVRTQETYLAIHLSETDWKDVVQLWMVEGGADPEDAAGFTEQIAAAVEGVPTPWLMNSDQGIALISPDQFISQFEDVTDTNVLEDIYSERMSHYTKGYTREHDDAYPIGHLIDQAGLRLIVADRDDVSNVERRHELVKAASILVAAIDKIDRAERVRLFGS